jgi:hypothetical protein
MQKVSKIVKIAFLLVNEPLGRLAGGADTP